LPLDIASAGTPELFYKELIAFWAISQFLVPLEARLK
jgi:hypothetical protein